MKTIDMHCDTLMAAFVRDREKGNISHTPECSIDVERLVEANAMAQFFAIYMLREPDYIEMDVPIASYEDYIAGCITIYERALKEHSGVLARATTAEEIQKNYDAGKVSAVLTMEDGVAVDGRFDNLKRFYDFGIRALSLTWNYENCFGYPNSSDPTIMRKGLKPFGKEAVEYMQELGMMVDVSHLSDGGFWDVMELARKPVVATHSNARSICNHQRNMTDDMIRALGNNGGIMGINFCPYFLDESKVNPVSTIERMVAMAVHERNIGGIDVIGIGTDFDGIEGNLEIKEPSQLERLAHALAKSGFTEREIDKIFWENALRVMKSAIL